MSIRKIIHSIKTNLGSITQIRWFIAIFLLFTLNPVSANEILEDVSFKDKGAEIEIRAKLSMPFSYVKHFPSKRGKIIQIQLKVDKPKVNKPKTKRRDLFNPTKDAPIEIRDVIFEGNVRGGPYLVFRFTNVVTFRVEKGTSERFVVVRIKKEKKPEVKVETKKVVSQEEKKLMEVDQLMRDARIALTNGKNSEAILLFSKLLTMHEHKHVIDAKEYLGLARERNGQLEMAKKEYEEYLKLYPKERRTNTVKQRLMTLNARLAAPRKQLKESKRTLALRKKEGLTRTDMFGRFSQNMILGWNKPEKESFTADPHQAVLLNYLNLSWRQRASDKEVRLVFSGSHEEDLERPDRTDNDGELDDRETRIRSMYGQYKSKRNRQVEFSFGRQSVNNGGVLGRFDGGVLGFQLKPKYKLYGVAGFPVDFVSHNSIQTNKPMGGVRLDIDKAIPNWQGSAYFIHQNVDGVTNRSAAGADARYIKNKTIFSSLFDYDVSYKTLNFVTAHYGWQFNKKTKIDVHFDQRRSPVMLTSNALQGLSSVNPELFGNETLDNVPDSRVIGALSPNVTYAELKDIKNRLTVQSMLDAGMTEAEIIQRAKDNTGRSTVVYVMLRRTLMKDLEMIGNITLNKYVAGKNFQQIVEEKESEDEENKVPKAQSFIPALEGWDIVTYAQLIQRNYFKPRDIIIGSLRYSNNASSTRYETSGTFRYPYKKKWWMDMKANFLFTQNTKNNENSARVNPRFKLQYRYNKKFSMDGEIGIDINKSETPGSDYVLTSANFGFQYLF